ncbi:uncharacterized protein LOC110429759 [Sorghum bicolor]|uniref:uncharacterized protein LOC110429759 n=1 Tax=Sorghum bicolor TaxID=4558 RepID=UPI000B425167|nr:uncharacterized protein LOC110429759 [Sorghum bicolor]|eukprot:XP_021301919.1 uncharacterized protein LOC110429759 [Sorghum bicolor]
MVWCGRVGVTKAATRFLFPFRTTQRFTQRLLRRRRLRVYCGGSYEGDALRRRILQVEQRARWGTFDAGAWRQDGSRLQRGGSGTGVAGLAPRRWIRHRSGRRTMVGRTRRRHTGLPLRWRSSLTGDGCSDDMQALRREAQNEARSRRGYAGFF